MAGIVLFVEWIISAIAGWFGFWLWLIVTPVVALFISFSGNGQALNQLKEFGIDSEGEKRFAEGVAPATMKFIAWQTILNAIIFGLGFGVHRLSAGG